jgi:thiamine pyrophosphate-dependent acetolactate synthase large subunit-like protein
MLRQIEILQDADARIAVLAGPGVVQHAQVDALRRLAERGNLAVVNTWGAKGVFPWDDPHHAGTAGLQARDFELCGFGEVDLIVATGIDPDEAPYERFALAPVLAVEPAALDDLALARRTRITRPAIFDVLAAVCMPQYTSDADPPPPGRRIADLKATFGPHDRVAADAGLAGFWVARAFPTTFLGSVLVPATREPGFAIRMARDAKLRGERVVAIVSDPVDDTDDIELQVWGEGGLPVDWSPTETIIDAAGEIVAWGGLSVP